MAPPVEGAIEPLDSSAEGKEEEEDEAFSAPMTVATISAGFEKGDFLVREDQGNRRYFDFFEEAFNYISNRGYSRMSREDEKSWVDLLNVIHDSVKGGMKFNTGTLLMVLSRPVTKARMLAAATATAATASLGEGKGESNKAAATKKKG